MPDDDQAASSTAEETEEGKTATSAETENTEGPKPNMVPQSRLNEMAQQKKEAQGRVSELEQKLQALEAKVTEGSIDPDTKAANDLIDERIKPRFAELTEKLSAAEKKAEDASALLQWNQMCAKAKVDPDDQELRGIVQGLAVIKGLEPAEALKRAAELLKAAKGGKKASTETDGVTGETITSDWVPKTAEEARAGARQGKLARQLSSVEIMSARQKRS